MLGVKKPKEIIKQNSGVPDTVSILSPYPIDTVSP